MKIRIIAAVLDTHRLVLYKEDGNSLEIPQGDPRVARLVDEARALTSQLVVEVDFDQAPVSNSHYAAFEQKTNGLVKFFRVAKKAVQSLLHGRHGEEPLAPEVLGQVPIPEQPAPAIDINHTRQAIDEIMANAQPLTVDPVTGRSQNVSDDETIVAQVGGAQGALVPGVEKLHDQIAHSARPNGSAAGVAALIQRLAKVIQEKHRGHSVQDVLTFLEKGDLPIADNGDIIAYKILRRSSRPGYYVDCHTKKVEQRVGSFVCVDESLVDRNRRNECSNGLHIARRGYLNVISGDAVVMIRMAPEDVVTVPHQDPNKVRVCGYHIIGVLPDEDFEVMKRGQPMISDAGKKMLARALAGDHIGRIEEVKIQGSMGSNVKVTSLDGSKVEQIPAPETPKPTKADRIEQAKPLDDPTLKGPKTVDPRAVAKDVATSKAEQASPRQDKAKRLLTAFYGKNTTTAGQYQAAEELVALKKAAKVSWATLGLSETDASLVLDLLSTGPAAAKKPTKPTPQPPAEAPKLEGDRIQIARQLYNRAVADYRQWPSLWLHKRKAKYSWSALGFTPDEEKKIIRNKPDSI